MIKKYSKMFKKVAKAENFGQHCLKHLRDTYAVSLRLDNQETEVDALTFIWKPKTVK